MQKARSQTTAHPKTRASSYRLLACGFRICFTPRTGVLFTCPSRYSSTIGHTGVFSLGGWSPQLHARTLVPGVTQEHCLTGCWSWLTGLSPSLVPRSKGLQLTTPCNPAGPTTPIPQGDGFRLGPVRSPLLRPSRLISLPPGTEMFQFPGVASPLAQGWPPSLAAGFPRSAISGSSRVSHSPEPLAAYHGLPRRRVPRHPPHAFSRL